MEARTTWPALIGALVRGETLTVGRSGVGDERDHGGRGTPASRSPGFAIALRIKGETASEVSGLAQAMLDHATPITVPGELTDLVGTGGDGAHTVNISTMGTDRRGGGRRPHGQARQPGGVSSACGAADVLEALGVVIDLPPAATEALADEIGVAFLFAPLYHPALRHAAGAAQRAGRAHRLQLPRAGGQPGPAQAHGGRGGRPRMGAVLAGRAGRPRQFSALVFHGDDGLDELTTTTTSAVWVVHGGTSAATEFDPADAGYRPGPSRTSCAAVTPRTTRGGPGGAGRRDRPGAGHRAAQRGRGAGRRGRRARPGGAATRRWPRAGPGGRARWTPGRRRRCSTAGRGQPAAGRKAASCRSPVWLSPG